MTTTPRPDDVEAVHVGDRVQIISGHLAWQQGTIWHIGPADLFGWFGSPIYIDLDDGGWEGPFQRDELRLETP